MEKLTVKKALEESIWIWTYLAETGGRKLIEDCEKYRFGCPLCTYVSQNGTIPDGKGEFGCTGICPVTWTPDKQPCGEIKSPYWIWSITGLDERREAANQVLALLQETLGRVRRNENGVSEG